MDGEGVGVTKDRTQPAVVNSGQLDWVVWQRSAAGLLPASGLPRLAKDHNNDGRA